MGSPRSPATTRARAESANEPSGSRTARATCWGSGSRFGDYRSLRGASARSRQSRGSEANEAERGTFAAALSAAPTEDRDGVMHGMHGLHVLDASGLARAAPR